MMSKETKHISYNPWSFSFDEKKYGTKMRMFLAYAWHGSLEPTPT